MVSAREEVEAVEPELTQLRGRRSRAASALTVSGPEWHTWSPVQADVDVSTATITARLPHDAVLLESPVFAIPPSHSIHISLVVIADQPCALRLGLRSMFRSEGLAHATGKGELCLGLSMTSVRGGRFRLVLAGHAQQTGRALSMRVVGCTMHMASVDQRRHASLHAGAMPSHWSVTQRTVHWLCARSRTFNAFVAAWEMHTGREELVSLPQYMAICPTGQCNASCGFCSVTTNRSGIVKKQLPFESLDRLIDPVIGTLRLFGLEGNGEPTLYDRFDELVWRVTAHGVPSYLITNGERLTPTQISLLLASRTDAINFSLNAATAATHRRVMKLRGWDAVVENIARFVRWRGDRRSPILSVSIVVTRDNVHEVQQFLHFSEWVLRVDRILVRPLSEIADGSGSVEDTRALVPYQSQIEDMLDAVAEYLEFVPRRAEIQLDPTTFSAYAADPEGPIDVPGLENVVLAPRRSAWHVAGEGVRARWRLNRLHLAAADGPARVLANTDRLHVPRSDALTFGCRVALAQGELCIALVDAERNDLVVRRLTPGRAAAQEVVLQFAVPADGFVSIEIRCSGATIDATVDFGRMYSMPPRRADRILLPHPSRWQIDRPGTVAHWEAHTLDLSGQAPPGLYIYRSYHVPTAPATTVAFTLSCAVRSGALGIGILSDDGTCWLRTMEVRLPEQTCQIVFDTGTYRGFQVVFYALTDTPLDARIDFADRLDGPPRHKSRDVAPKRLILPPAEQWTMPTPGATVRWEGHRIDVVSAGQALRYLACSPRFPAPSIPGAVCEIPVRIVVRSGELGIGFLGGRDEQFTATCNFAVGEHVVRLPVATGGESELIAVLYARTTDPLDAQVDWLDALAIDFAERVDLWRGGLFDLAALLEPDSGAPVASNAAPKMKSDETGVASTGGVTPRPRPRERLATFHRIHGLSGIVGRGTRVLFGPLARRLPPRWRRFSWKRLGERTANAALQLRFPDAQVYCTKPWTDLHNFTVDGRMDVCCIATGPSQERHALGNIFTQDFQSIWNGEPMREFRRTVNGEAKLPPCARCPMANHSRLPF